MSSGKSRGRGDRRVKLCKCGRVAEGRSRMCWKCAGDTLVYRSYSDAVAGR